MNAASLLRRSLAATFLFALFATSLFPSGAAEPRLNFSFILIDDYGWTDTACYGSKFNLTPNLDKLASQGMRFTDAYSACPVCSPTRAAIMTGKYPARLHLTDWLPGRADRSTQKLLRPVIRQQLPLSETTLAYALKPLGYTSASVGKWHLGGAGFTPRAHGFDVNIAGDHTGTPMSYFAPYRNNTGQMPGLGTAPEGEYLTDRLTTEAEKFITANTNRPFFLYLPHYTVHIPLRAKQELIAKHAARTPPAGSTHTNAIYAAMIESMDESVGRIMKKLDDLKLADRTVVIFTADNGGLAVREGPNTPSTSNAPLREGKGYLYEGGIRVPLIVRWPGVVKPGSVNATPVSSVDYFPTILELAGAQPGAPRVVDGVSLVPVLKGGELKPRPLFWHYPHYANQGGKPGAVVREGDWKLIEFYENGRWELYNLKDDIGETNNLAAKEPQRAAQLGRKLDDWRISVKAQMMLPNPNYSAAAEAEPKKEVTLVRQNADGTVLLHSRDATVHGTNLRYEPQTNKITLGYWTKKEDWAGWDFQIVKAGKFEVEILQGCGKGSGGAEVDFLVANQKLKHTVMDTGHFQNFVPFKLGTVDITLPGRYEFAVKPQTKPGVAVMDLRQVVLRPLR